MTPQRHRLGRPLNDKRPGRAGGAGRDDTLPVLEGFVAQLNWSLLGLVSEVRSLPGRAFEATTKALFGETIFDAEGAKEAILSVDQVYAILHLRTLDLVPLASIRVDRLPLGKRVGTLADEVKGIRAGSRRHYRDLQRALVRECSRGRSQETTDPFEGLTLLKQTYRVSRPSHGPSADELAARLADGVAKLNLATLALLREIPRAGVEGAEVAAQLAPDGDGEALVGLAARYAVEDLLLFLVAAACPPMAVPAVDRFHGLSLQGTHESMAQGWESRDRYQSLLTEFIRITEEEVGDP
ncbi:MAG: hypothetical protein ACE5JD_12045 [Candidatus Methylomirabilia bacterium]